MGILRRQFKIIEDEKGMITIFDDLSNYAMVDLFAIVLISLGIFSFIYVYLLGGSFKNQIEGTLTNFGIIVLGAIIIFMKLKFIPRRLKLEVNFSKEQLAFIRSFSIGKDQVDCYNFNEIDDIYFTKNGEYDYKLKLNLKGTILGPGDKTIFRISDSREIDSIRSKLGNFIENTRSKELMDIEVLKYIRDKE
ncbi:MAG: hypothetical protein ACFFCS_21360 [Candidatus Hodarchaeota archaeon]